MMEQSMEYCLLWKGPHAGDGLSVRSPCPEEEGAAETTCDELTVTPTPRPSAPLGGEEVEKQE